MRFNRLRREWLLGLLMMVWLPACTAEKASAETFQEGTHYKTLARAVPTSSEPGKVEVVEFFLYSCPHCYKFEPLIGQWAKNPPEGVSFKTVPASFGPNAELHAKAHYTAINLGVKDKVHAALFDAIHKQQKHLNNEAVIEQVFVSQGVDSAEFKKAFNSFTVDNQVRRGEVLGQAYAVAGVPALAVAGKYWITAAKAGGYDKMLDVALYLVNKELGK